MYSSKTLSTHTNYLRGLSSWFHSLFGLSAVITVVANTQTQWKMYTTPFCFQSLLSAKRKWSHISLCSHPVSPISQMRKLRQDRLAGPYLRPHSKTTVSILPAYGRPPWSQHCYLPRDLCQPPSAHATIQRYISWLFFRLWLHSNNGDQSSWYNNVSSRLLLLSPS